MEKSMKEKMKPMGGGTIIKKFIDRNEGLLHEVRGKSALFVQDYCSEMFVIQTVNGTCFVFEFDCGELSKIKTEHNAMERYMMLIPTSEYAEYITF